MALSAAAPNSNGQLSSEAEAPVIVSLRRNSAPDTKTDEKGTGSDETPVEAEVPEQPVFQEGGYGW